MSLKKMESIPALLETAPTRIDELKLKLQELKKEVQVHPNNLQKLEEIRKTREELLSLQREFNRTKQYTTISNNRLAEWKTSLDSIDASSLMRIDKETSKDTRGEFLSRSFLYKRLTDSEWNISELPVESEKIKDWDELFVDLGKSTSRKSAYWKIGLGDMLPVWIWYVSVNGAIGVRAIINGRVGYYTKPSPDGYIPVFTGTIVKIPSASDIGIFEWKKDPALKRNIDQKESNAATDMKIERLEHMPESSNIEVSTLMRESYDFWKSKWFSEEQIAWLLANESRESRCNPNAEDEKKVSYGIFQWKKERRDIIHTKTGIDIMKSSHKQQLEAAFWEMTEDGFEKKLLPLLKNAKTSKEAASIISSEYLRPGDASGEPKIRWEMAENIFNQFKYINNPELANLPEWEANKRIVEFALDAQRRWDILGAIHCTDWVDRVYKQTTWTSVYRNSLYDGVSGTKISLWTGYHGTHASLGQLSIIQPWNHIMVDHMENGQFSQGRTHSVIALSRPINGIVEVVAYPNWWKPPVIEKYDLTWESRAKNGKVLRIQSA